MRWLRELPSDPGASLKLEITRRSDLAVRALRALGSQDDRIKGTELAELIDSTTGFLPQVLAPLVRQRWIDSVPGPTGGYRLAVDLDDISLLDVIEAVEGPVEQDICVLDSGDCDKTNRCAIHEAWMAARDRLYEELAGTTISRVAHRK
jgi:Rrf2 family protein